MLRRSVFYRRIRLFSYFTLALLSVAAIIIIIRTDSDEDASSRLVVFGKDEQSIGDNDKVQIINDDHMPNDGEQVSD